MGTQDVIDQREWENPTNWVWGIAYHSGRDSRWMVPKRPMKWGPIRQIGWTLNFAYRRSWWMLLGLSIVPLGFTLLAILLTMGK
jgi:uncharacterized membrane protein